MLSSQSLTSATTAEDETILQDGSLPEVPAPVLQVNRLPGEFGPILRCEGELTQATGEF
jgi:hypothetical protein